MPDTVTKVFSCSLGVSDNQNLFYTKFFFKKKPQYKGADGVRLASSCTGINEIEAPKMTVCKIKGFRLHWLKACFGHNGSIS